MSLFRTLAVVLGLALMLAIASSCYSHQQTGAVGGAGAGALTGAALTGGSTTGTLLGAVVGAAVGSEVGRQMDEYDRRQAAFVLEQTPTNVTRSWENPDTGQAYQMTPVETYDQPGAGGPCREFRMQARVGNGWEDVYGTACRQNDGSWQIRS